LERILIWQSQMILAYPIVWKPLSQRLSGLLSILCFSRRWIMEPAMLCFLSDHQSNYSSKYFILFSLLGFSQGWCHLEDCFTRGCFHGKSLKFQSHFQTRKCATIQFYGNSHNSQSDRWIRLIFLRGVSWHAVLPWVKMSGQSEFGKAS
jgi:hypothetical protein